MRSELEHRIIWPTLLLPTLGFALASLGYHDWFHLGAEYDEIARAIYNGRGFSDPFGIETGPTAWMPPVLPYLMSACYAAAGGDRMTVMILFLILQWTAIASSVGLVLREAIRLRRYGWGLAVVIIGVAINFDMLFRMTHDHALLILMVNALYRVLSKDCSRLSPKESVLQGLFGGFVAMCNPILATAWAAWIALKSKSIKTVTIAAIVSFAVILPWTIRNYVVFDRIVPIKSAAKFEFFQALCISPDGVVGPECFIQHPWGKDNAARREYASVGEAAFIDARGEPAMQKWRTEPMDCIDRLNNRFVTATLWSEVPSTYGLPFLIAVFSRLVYVWPFLSLGCLVIQISDDKPNKRRLTRPWSVAAYIYVAVLLPYVLISYYIRYAAPLLAIKCLLVLYVIDFLHREARPRLTRA
jgi:hypothetical protein